ncbi:PREDICTED: uncharacterized protein LOC104588407 isoform X2 [Nelumbo nucifera]|uniref:Uncharacterized protein LOC104588407 isoform X2 n=1 Tax=Nelumbo nucifera TaxID=4432 RepID=A0A1U8PYS6_NELNU|nr:PREDICTED: uncharacterized protein LOC104588407 isoform X2 [Nelumbo nucifera]
MGSMVYYGFRLSLRPRLNLRMVRALCSIEPGGSRLQILEQVDKELASGNDVAALSLARDLQGKPGGLRCFGAARQIPQRLYTLDELKLNNIDTLSLLSPVDATLGSIERNLQVAAVLAGISAWVAFGLTQQQILLLSLGLLFLWSLDLHEAGHFIIAYLLGILPKGYTLSSLEALRKEGSLNVQAGTAFVDFEFVEEVNKGKVSAQMLNRFSCIALAGVATEYLLFGCAEGGLADIDKLDRLLKGLGFTQKKADSQVRWAVLNIVLLLRRHEGARSKLAEAMSMGRSVGFCIDTIEKAIDDVEI